MSGKGKAGSRKLWMPANLLSGVEAGAGKWRVAPLPQWNPGDKASAENGGSALSGPAAGGNKALAKAFLKYATAEEGVQLRVAGGAFPATTAELSSPEFLGAEFPNSVARRRTRSSPRRRNVISGWSYPPFQVYANSVFNDTLGKAYVSDTPLYDGLSAWQDASVEYGQEQGFTLDGAPFRMISGALHYFRVHPELWADRMREAKWMGLNTIDTYIPWNLHEPQRGVLDAEAGLDLPRFLDLAQEHARRGRVLLHGAVAVAGGHADRPAGVVVARHGDSIAFTARAAHRYVAKAR